MSSSSPELKLSIVDVKCTDAHGVTYVVEMQVLQVEGFEKRVVYNVAKAYVNQIARGEGYPNLNDVVGITICDFVLWPEQTQGMERWVPNLKRVNIKGSGHWTQQEKPAEVNAAILEFLSDLR